MPVLSNEMEARDYVATLCDGDGFARLERLVAMLVDENSQQNLVARASLECVWQRHIADSAQLLEHVSRETLAGPWLDLGAGAGFPGLVIAAIMPGVDVRLVESRRRRIEWLETAAAQLALDKCQILGSRLEQVQAFEAQVISARAFAPLPKLLELSSRFSTKDTVWVLPKGRSAAQDLSALSQNQAKLFHVEQSRTDSEAGIIVGRFQPKVRARA